MTQYNTDFSRQIINVRERPLSTDINELQSQLDATRRDLYRQTYASAQQPNPQGFVNTGLQVGVQSPLALGVQVAVGNGFQVNDGDIVTSINSVTGLDDLSGYKPVVCSQSVAIPMDAAPPGGQERWDLIEVSYLSGGSPDRRLFNSLSRDVFNTSLEAFQPTGVLKTFSWDVSLPAVNRAVAPANNPANSGLGYKRGVQQATGSGFNPPGVSTGYIALAYVYVGPGVTTITAPNIIDARRLLLPGGLVNVAASFTLPIDSANPSPPTGLVQSAPGSIVVTPVTRGLVSTTPTGRGCLLYVFNVNGLNAAAPALVASSLSFSGPIGEVITGDVIGDVRLMNAGLVSNTEVTLATSANSGNATYVPTFDTQFWSVLFYPHRVPNAGGALDQTFGGNLVVTFRATFAV